MSDGQQFMGRIEEPNTFSQARVPSLFADIKGNLGDNGVVTFTKKYDGTGGVDHFVHYSGKLNIEGNFVSGEWRIREDSKGRFEMWRR